MDDRRPTYQLFQDLGISEPGSPGVIREVSTEKLQDMILGVGPVNARRIIAAYELGRRSMKPPRPENVLSNAEDTARWLRMEYPSENNLLVLLLLNQRHRLLDQKLLYKSPADNGARYIYRPAEVYRDAVRCNAKNILIADIRPSHEKALINSRDITFIRRLRISGGFMEIELKDYLVVGNGWYMSYRNDHPREFFQIED